MGHNDFQTLYLHNDQLLYFSFLILYFLFIGEKEYYEKQIATLKSFEEVDSLLASDEIDEEDLVEQAQQERAMKISNFANVILLAFKVSRIHFFEI